MRGAKHLDSLLHIFVILEVVLLASGLIIKVLDNGPLHYATYLALPTLKVVVFVVRELALERIKFSLGLGFVALEACHLAQGRQQFEALAVVAEVVLFHVSTKVGILLVGELELCGAGYVGMGGAVLHTVVEELGALLQVDEQVGHTVGRGYYIGRDAATVAHNASGSSAELVRQRVGQVHGQPVLKLVSLHTAARGYVVLARGELEYALVGQFATLLHKALAIGAAAHDEGAVVVLQGTARNFGCRGRALVGEHYDGQVGILCVEGGLVGVVELLHLAACGHHLAASGYEQVDGLDSLLEHPAGVVAQVKHKATGAPLLKVDQSTAYFV